MRRTWKDNADEFAALDNGEGWPFARLVACSVQKGAGNGRPPKGKTSARAEVSKVSAEEFARRAGTSGDRVLRYLTAWDKAAKAGLCSPSTDLSPADSATTMEPDAKWDETYVGKVRVDSGLTGKAADIANNPSAVAKAIKASPKLAKALVADEAVAEAIVKANRPAVRRAQEKVSKDEFDQMIRDHGGTPGGVDLSAELGFDPDLVLEVSRINGLMDNYRRRIVAVLDTCRTEEQRAWVRERLLPDVEAIMATLVPVPDTIEGLTR